MMLMDGVWCCADGDRVHPEKAAEMGGGPGWFEFKSAPG